MTGGDRVRRGHHTSGPGRRRRDPGLILGSIPVRLALTAVAGGLYCAAFPPVGWWWMAIPAFAVFAWVLTHRATTAAGGAGYGLIFGLAFYIPLVPWAGAYAGVIAWMALAVLCAAFTPFFGLTAVLVRGLPGWPVWFAVLWQLSEWLRSWIPFGGVPWGVVATGQTSGPLLPVVRLGGSPLLSVAVVLVGCAVAAALPDRRDVTGARWQPRHLIPSVTYVGAVALVTGLAWGVVSRPDTDPAPPVTVAVVQGSVPQLGYDFNAQRRAVLDYHVHETMRLAADVQAGKTPQPDLVVWPENSSDIDPLRNPDAGNQIALAADTVRAPILVGALLLVSRDEENAPVYTNTVIVWEPGTGPADRHTKQFVQPFGEYLPLPVLFSYFSHVNRYGYITPGRSTGVVQAGGVAVGVGSCWEVTFDRALRQSVRNGAEILAVPANAATFGRRMSEQELAFATVRAVEFDRDVAVASTTGISAVITAEGREVAATEHVVPAYLNVSMQPRNNLTPAARWGAPVQWALVGIGVCALVVAAFRRDELNCDELN